MRQVRARDSDVEARLAALLGLPAFGGRVQLRMNSKLYYIGLGLALSAVLWGTMILVLMPVAYGSEFGSSTITSSTTTDSIATIRTHVVNSNSTQTQICYSSGSCTVITTQASASSSTTSDYLRLGIVLSIVLVAVLAAIAYFRRKK